VSLVGATSSQQTSSTLLVYVFATILDYAYFLTGKPLIHDENTKSLRRKVI